MTRCSFRFQYCYFPVVHHHWLKQYAAFLSAALNTHTYVCIRTRYNTILQFYILCNCFHLFRSSAHLPSSFYSFDLIFMLLSLECSTSLWAHNCFLHSFSFLLVSPTVCSVFFWIRSQIRQWPFYAMFISCNNEILFSVILLLFWFWFMLCCFFLFFFSVFSTLVWSIVVAVALSLDLFFRFWVRVSSHDVSFIVYVLDSKFWWKKSTKSSF